MRKALVVRQVAHEGLGTIERPLAREFKVDYVDVYRGAGVPASIEGYSALVVMGGPMGVYEEDLYPFIGKELSLLRSALKERVPTLGICLGAQLLAKAAGAEVFKGKTKEIGWHKVTLTDDGADDRLFLGFPGEFTVFQWHGDTFGLPEGSSHLAGSKLFANQVFKAGPCAYGIQFHLEVTERMVREWVDINAGELEALSGKVDPAAILADAPEEASKLQRLGGALVSRFIRLAKA